MTVRVAHVATIDLTHRFLLLPQLRRLRDEGYDVTAISAPGPWTADLEAEGIRFVPWRNATRAWDPRADARAFAELMRLFREGGYDLVHTHNPKPGVLGRLAAWAAGVPCVVNTVHGFWATPEDPARRRVPVLAAERLAATCSNLELFQSEEDLAWARRSRIVRPSRSALLGNGTDMEAFVPPIGADAVARREAVRRSLGVEDDEVVVGCVGRLVAEKGYRELFRAARAVRAADPRVRFVAVGGVDGDKDDALGEEELAAAADDVLVTGWRDDVRDLLAAFDVFVLPSWREGLPRSAVEAAATGLPLVLTDIRGCREVARDGVEGFLVPPRDADALAAAIARLAGDAELRATMGKAARRRAEARFDERRVADTVVAAYAALLRRRGIAPPAARTGDGAVEVRPARPSDAAAIARIHARTMPDAFLPSLGPGFLARLYRAIAADPDAVAFVADRGGDVVGFAAAAPSVRGLYRRFALRQGVAAGLAAAPRLARPSVLRRVRETATYPDRAGGLPDAELLSIAVLPEARRGGLARRLSDATLEALAARGVAEVKVVVDARNDPANAFYRDVGFRPARTIHVHDGVTSNVWVIACRSSSPSPSPSR